MRILLAPIFVLLLSSCHHNVAERTSKEASLQADAGIKGVHRDHKGKPAPDAAFKDADGKTLKLADFKGKPVLVNLWATWCAPCVKELPTLDKLARTKSLAVVAISEDTGPHESVMAFLKSHQITSLKSYQDPNMGLSGALGADTVLPTSILVDSSGNEVWRYVGDLDWTSAEAAKLLGESGDASKTR